MLAPRLFGCMSVWSHECLLLQIPAKLERERPSCGSASQAASGAPGGCPSEAGAKLLPQGLEPGCGLACSSQGAWSFCCCQPAAREN